MNRPATRQTRAASSPCDGRGGEGDAGAVRIVGGEGFADGHRQLAKPDARIAGSANTYNHAEMIGPVISAQIAKARIRTSRC